MATLKVYDLDGVEHEKEAIDARECVSEMGWSFTPHETVENQDAAPGSDAIKEYLKSRGVDFNAKTKDEKLIELYTAEKAKEAAGE